MKSLRQVNTRLTRKVSLVLKTLKESRCSKYTALVMPKIQDKSFPSKITLHTDTVNVKKKEKKKCSVYIYYYTCMYYYTHVVLITLLYMFYCCHFKYSVCFSWFYVSLLYTCLSENNRDELMLLNSHVNRR